MKLVVDANVLFSVLIKQDVSAELLLDLSLNLYAPEFMLEEFEKYEQEILSKTKRTKHEFNEIFNVFKEIINFVPKREFEECFSEAEEIAPDEKDTEYLALAFKFNCPIWSNDKKLKEQNKVKVYSTSEMFGLLKK